MAYFDDRYQAEQEAAKPSEPVEPVVEQNPAPVGFSDGFGLPYDVPIVRPEKKKRGVGKKILCIFLVLALVVTCCLATAYFLNDYWSRRFASLNRSVQEQMGALRDQIQTTTPPVETTPPVIREPVEEGALTPGQIYQDNVDAVVAISCVFQGSYFGSSTEPTSCGSGFIITEDGYVVTNYHVVEDALRQYVNCHDGTEYEAELVGYDRDNDIALLKVDATDLPTVTIGSSDELNVGDRVCAIGNSLGMFSSSLTVGYVSGKDRVVTTEGTTINMIQTDTAINPGNSGGPLFNMKGEVIGITSAKFSGTTSSGASIEGMGFAIPMDDVVGMFDDLRELGYVTGAYMGVSVRDVEDAVLVYGIPDGVFVEVVYEDTAAELAGMQAGDVIVDVGGHKVESMTQLDLALRKFMAGDTSTITVYRSGQTVELTITFDEKPVEQAQQETTTDDNTFTWDSDFPIEEFFKMFPWFG